MLRPAWHVLDADQNNIVALSPASSTVLETLVGRSFLATTHYLITATTEALPDELRQKSAALRLLQLPYRLATRLNTHHGLGLRHPRRYISSKPDRDLD